MISMFHSIFFLCKRHSLWRIMYIESLWKLSFAHPCCNRFMCQVAELIEGRDCDNGIELACPVSPAQVRKQNPCQNLQNPTHSKRKQLNPKNSLMLLPCPVAFHHSMQIPLCTMLCPCHVKARQSHVVLGHQSNRCLPKAAVGGP